MCIWSVMNKVLKTNILYVFIWQKIICVINCFIVGHIRLPEYKKRVYPTKILCEISNLIQRFPKYAYTILGKEYWPIRRGTCISFSLWIRLSLQTYVRWLHQVVFKNLSSSLYFKCKIFHAYGPWGIAGLCQVSFVNVGFSIRTAYFLVHGFIE